MKIINKKKKPNIILICVDALRKKDLFIYSFPFNIAPNLHNFAMNSTVFTKAYTVSSWTGTVISSLFSGKLPSEHKVFREKDIFEDKILINQDKDYYNFCISSNPWIREEFGFAKGWDNFKYISTSNCEEVFNEFYKIRENNRNKPFLAYLHFMDLHGPFNKYWGEYLNKEFAKEIKRYFFIKKPGSKIAEIKDKLIIILSKSKNKIRKKLDKYRSVEGKVYTNTINSLSCLAKFDKFFGDFIKYLRKVKLIDNTIVIFFSDHGDERDEHAGGIKGHNHSLYEEVVQIPLFIHFPQEKFQIFEKLFSILEFYKIIQFIQGKDLSSANFNLNNLNFDDFILGQLAFDGKNKLAYLFKNGYKFIKNYSNNKKEFYNLTLDSKERNNLYDKIRNKSLKYERELDEKIKFTNSNDKHKVKLDKKIKKRLRHLGYL